MKLSLVSAILLIQGIAANPLFKSKAKHSKGDRVNFRIHLSKGCRVNQKLPLISTSREAMHSKSPTDCWAACFAEDPDCPETMYPTPIGTDDDPCWTCCVPSDDDDDGL